MTKTSNQSQGKNNKKRHRFFLNPYSDCAFTKCPKCETKTKVRKFPLVIHIEPQQLFILNKQCKYCPSCDLIIAKQKELESLMAIGIIQSNPDLIGNKYLVMGTVDRNDWKEGSQNVISPSEIVKRMYIFKDVWNFEVIPAGWYPASEK
jgi:MinD superfamily P-loop ATPase